MWTAIGAFAFLLAARVPIERVRKFIPLMLLVTAAMLIAVLVPGFGTSAGGSSRWIGVGPLSVQPSELTKLVIALFLADLVERREDHRDEVRDLVRPMLIVLGFFAILIVKQPDLGTALVLACMSIGALYIAGVRRIVLVGVVTLLGSVAALVALVAPYRRARLFSFVNPFGHASSTGYQVVQSLIALASGHVGGTGVGSSVAIWGWLPNAQTDFVFAVVGAQLGLIGAAVLIATFVILGWTGLRIAGRAEDRFSCLVATAISCWIVCQAIINIGGVVGALPETGIPLPFVSSGGSSLVVVLAAMGLLARISRRSTAALRARQ
jgi:cell division protein FtsW